MGVKTGGKTCFWRNIFAVHSGSQGIFSIKIFSDPCVLYDLKIRMFVKSRSCAGRLRYLCFQQFLKPERT